MGVLALNYLPVGYRFSPTDEELVNHYLKLKIRGEDSKVEAIPEVDVCKWEPWDLPNLSVIKNADPEWFFFCPRDQKYPKGRRSNRATEKGYWKATGKDRTIKARSSGMKLIGMKKTLVFHMGRAPGGQRTAWIMHEYRLSSEEGSFVLCRLFNKEKEESNCDEIEPSGSSPAAANSSPDSIRLEKTPVQATSDSDMQSQENLSIKKKWLEDKSDNITSNTPVPEQSYSNSWQASDVGDLGVELRAAEVDAPQGQYVDIFDNHTLETLDQALPPLHVKMSTGLAAPCYLDSSFANEFGNIQNEILFQDDMKEQDLFDLDFLEKVFRNQGPCDDSVGQEHSAFESGHDSVCVIQSGESVFGKDSNSASDTDNEVSQVQAYPETEGSLWPSGPVNTNGSLQMEKDLDLDRSEGFYGSEIWNQNIDLLLSDPPAALNYSLVDPPAEYQVGWSTRINPADETRSTVGTGVKIRARQPQYHSSSQNMISHGTASRRMRLQRKLFRRVSSFRVRESSSNVKDKEAKPTVSKTTGGVAEIESPSVYPLASGLAAEDGNEISHELETKLRIRSRPGFANNQNDSSPSAQVPAAKCPFSYSLRYIAFVPVIITLVGFFVGAWRSVAP